MRKIIDVGVEDSESDMASYLFDANNALTFHGRGSLGDVLAELKHRIDDAPEVTDTTVLIDTDNIEQMSELADRYVELLGVSKRNKAKVQGRLAIALREFGKPPIEEPVLFGAVIRGGDGKRWTRTFAGNFGPAAETWANGRLHTEWRLLDAKEILSPGVPAEQSNLPF